MAGLTTRVLAKEQRKACGTSPSGTLLPPPAIAGFGASGLRWHRPNSILSHLSTCAARRLPSKELHSVPLSWHRALLICAVVLYAQLFLYLLPHTSHLQPAWRPSSPVAHAATAGPPGSKGKQAQASTQQQSACTPSSSLPLSVPSAWRPRGEHKPANLLQWVAPASLRGGRGPTRSSVYSYNNNVPLKHIKYTDTTVLFAW